MYLQAIGTSLGTSTVLLLFLLALERSIAKHGHVAGLWFLVCLVNLSVQALVVLRAFYNRSPGRKASLAGWGASAAFWAVLGLVCL